MNGQRTSVRATLILTLALGAAAWTPARAAAQLEAHCEAAEQFLVELAGVVALTEPDTIDDWRTKQMVPGCRITAAGVTRSTVGREAERFYELVRAAGWTRTPDPRDAPGEASLRFRMEESDCLFNVYEGIIVGTAAEREVSMEAVPGPGERRWNLLVMCTPAMEAAPRG